MVVPNVNGSDVSSNLYQFINASTDHARHHQVPTGSLAWQSSPFDKKLILAEYHLADQELVSKAIDGALAAKKKWSQSPLHERAAIFYRAAHLIATTYRNEMMAVTMLGQGKNLYQGDIDCVAEVIAA